MFKQTAFLYYQDCPCCGSREAWCKRQQEIAQAAGIKIIKVPFYQDGAAEVIRMASKAGFSLPFYASSDGFAKDIRDFVQKAPEPTEAPEKKTKRAKRAKKTEVKTDETPEVVDGQSDAAE